MSREKESSECREVKSSDVRALNSFIWEIEKHLNSKKIFSHNMSNKQIKKSKKI